MITQKGLTYKSLRISSDLSDNDVDSAHKLAICYTRPIHGNLSFPLADAIWKSHEYLVSVRRFEKIFWLESIVEIN